MFHKIKLKLRAYDYRLLDKATNNIVSTVYRAGASVSGPIPLPTKIERFTVNRGVNIDKKSREQFQRVSHFRLIVIESSPTTLDALRKIDIASGIDIKVEEGR
jgi:small subunit ribosomal protein S10